VKSYQDFNRRTIALQRSFKSQINLLSHLCAVLKGFLQE
jgi:hypothetical protein